MSVALDIPELEFRAARLDPEERTTLGREGPAAETLGDRVRIGGPVVAPVSAQRAAGDDEVLKALAEHADASRFHMVVLGCSFEPEEHERFDRVWVQIRLSTGAADPAVAWSMEPLRSAAPYKLSRQVEVGAQLKFVTAKVAAGRDDEAEDAFVEARNLLRVDPTWRFSRVNRHEIVDEHRLVLMVKAPGGTETTGEVRLRAVLRRRALGPISYRVTVPEAPYAPAGDAVSGRFALAA